MMRTTILVTALLVSMLSASAAYAQRVETTLLDGLHPVINCDGMPIKAYTTETKGNTEERLITAEANEKVYKRFAVHKIDNSSSSNWTNAFTICSGVGDGWRLPTQRELQLMWVLKSALEKAGGFTPFNATSYWSATDYYGSCWLVNFNDGYTDANSKPNGYSVRCIKEL